MINPSYMPFRHATHKQEFEPRNGTLRCDVNINLIEYKYVQATTMYFSQIISKQFYIFTITLRPLFAHNGAILTQH